MSTFPKAKANLTCKQLTHRIRFLRALINTWDKHSVKIIDSTALLCAQKGKHRLAIVQMVALEVLRRRWKIRNSAK